MSISDALVRPLGRLSDFVVDEMPILLACQPEQLGAAADHVVQTWLNESLLDHVVAIQDPVAAIDVKMLELALIHSGNQVPERLAKAVEDLSKNRTTALTYADIVERNPVFDRRTFTAGESRESESIFYHSHYKIEQHLKAIIAAARTILNQIKLDPQCDVRVPLSETELTHRLREIYSCTIDTIRINSDHFNTFRVYLASHPIRGTKGSSGAYSYRMPLLELLLRKSVPDKFKDDLRTNAPYYEAAGWRQLDTALGGGELTLEKALSMNDSPALREFVSTLQTFFDRWRQSHYNALKHHLPGSLSGEVVGTGGETDPDAFLRARMEHK